MTPEKKPENPWSQLDWLKAETPTGQEPPRNASSPRAAEKRIIPHRPTAARAVLVCLAGAALTWLAIHEARTGETGLRFFYLITVSPAETRWFWWGMACLFGPGTVLAAITMALMSVQKRAVVIEKDQLTIPAGWFYRHDATIRRETLVSARLIETYGQKYLEILFNDDAGKSRKVHLMASNLETPADLVRVTDWLRMSEQ